MTIYRKELYIKPPESRVVPLTADERKEHLARLPYKGRYDHVIDRESAYEMLKQKAQKQVLAAKQQAVSKRPSSAKGSRQSPMEAMVTSVARSMGNQIGRQIMRGIMGSLFGRR